MRESICLAACAAISFAIGAQVSAESAAAAIPTIEKYVLESPPRFDVVTRDGRRLLLNVGSGLSFKSKNKQTLEFYAVTDRGPNADGPGKVEQPAGAGSKVFLVPGFQPTLGVIQVADGHARLVSTRPLINIDGTPVSGLPPEEKSAKTLPEVPLDANYRFDATVRQFDRQGLDVEAVTRPDKDGKLWMSDEYGPYILRVDARTGKIVQKFAPGTTTKDLPAVFGERRANRGLEGLTIDPSNGKLYGSLQSPIDPQGADGKSLKARTKDGSSVEIKHQAKFLRWLELDPQTGARRTFAYPLDGSLYEKGRTGAAKVGDIVALGDGKFLAIEQGARRSDGKVQNWLMRVELSPAITDITGFGHGLEMSSIAGESVDGADFGTVVALKKERVLDLNAFGWTQSKVEGLTVIDERTIAIINDNDFGLASELRDEAGRPVAGSIEDCTVDAGSGRLRGCASADAVKGALTIADSKDAPVELWIIHFEESLATIKELSR